MVEIQMGSPWCIWKCRYLQSSDSCTQREEDKEIFNSSFNNILSLYFCPLYSHDKDSWINLYHDSQGFYWMNSWQTPDYQNIAPGGPGQWGNVSCGKANFGGDGLWYPANCSVPLPSYICEAAPGMKASWCMKPNHDGWDWHLHSLMVFLCVCF